jgi:ABC-type cobalamin/Fe3+-siderophores transport system ATPase subunit
MQEIIIVAGPNGAGETSLANKHFERPKAGLVYLIADEIARELTGAGIPQQLLNVRAGAVDDAACGRHSAPPTALPSNNLRTLQEASKQDAAVSTSPG